MDPNSKSTISSELIASSKNTATKFPLFEKLAEDENDTSAGDRNLA